MTNEPINEVKLKETFLQKIQSQAILTFKKIKDNQPLLRASILTIICLVFFVGILYPTIWQPQIILKQSWFGLACVLSYLAASSILVYFSKWDKLKTASVLIQSNLLMFISFAYFLRLSHREFLIFNLPLNTGLVFIILSALIFLVNYNLFGKNIRQKPLLFAQTVLFALQGYSFLSLTGTYITDTTNFSNDWLNTLFSLHPFFWLAISALAISSISGLSLATETKENLLKFIGLSSFLMVQGILMIYLASLIDPNLHLTYWNLTLMALIFWDFLDTPLKIISLKIEDNKFAARLGVSMVYHGLLFIMVILAPQLQLAFR